MAYEEELAERVGELVEGEPGLSEKRMFGGLAFLIEGNMAVAVSGKGGLMVRVDPEETGVLLAEPYAGPFEMNGREVRGWLRVDAAGLTSAEKLRRWVQLGVEFARTLPPSLSAETG
ncbi:MAG: TfoX/Sxy family protein [Solirubrobacterales bacterium]